MKMSLYIITFMLLTAGNAFAGIGHEHTASGDIASGESYYDGKRFAWLEPGSLFDNDNSPGLFKVGLVWDERYADKLHLIVNFPLGKSMSPTELGKKTGVLKLDMDGKKSELPRVVGSVVIKEEGGFGKEVKTYIRFEVTRQIIKSMLSSKQVHFELDAASKVYKGNLYVPAQVKNYYQDAKYTAINGMKRFYKEVWGD